MTKIEIIKTQLDSICMGSNILPEVMNIWCDTLRENYSKFDGKDFHGIYEILDSLRISGIDERTIQMTASIIADVEGADMNIDKNVATVFMTYSKENE